MTELGPIFKTLLAVLDLLEIPYSIEGSVASGSYGLPRQTNNIDIIADFSHADLGEFAQSLEGEFYLDRQAAAEAILQGRSFNAIHLNGAFKFDFFPAGADDMSYPLCRGFPILNSPSRARKTLCFPSWFGFAKEGELQIGSGMTFWVFSEFKGPRSITTTCVNGLRPYKWPTCSTRLYSK